jgi:hypothetical protein
MEGLGKNTKQRFRSRNKKTTPIEFSWIEKMGFRKRLQILGFGILGLCEIGNATEKKKRELCFVVFLIIIEGENMISFFLEGGKI